MSTKLDGMSEPKIVGQCGGFPCVRHVDCGGQIAIGAECTYSMPIGIGFRDHRGSHQCVFDSSTYRAYDGFCMKCSESGMFIHADVKPRRKTSAISGTKVGA